MENFDLTESPDPTTEIAAETSMQSLKEENSKGNLTKIFLFILLAIVIIIIIFLVGFLLGRNTEDQPPVEPTPTVTDTPTLEPTSTESPEPSPTETVTPTVQMSIKLFYPKFGSGDDPCDPANVIAVNRKIPETSTPLKASLELLLKGDLTDEEVTEGFQTEFPLEQFKLKSVSIAGGTANISFNDPLNKSGGGSCRTGVLESQVRKTALQFPGVSDVQYDPEYGYFQP